MTLKSKAIECCKKQLLDKIQTLSSALEEIAESISAETKSSVGDKHETARARMQQEQGKLEHQLDELHLQLRELERVEDRPRSLAGFGALIETDSVYFFIATAIGKIKVDGIMIYVISAQSPIALSMKGLVPPQQFEFNGTPYTIKTIT